MKGRIMRLEYVETLRNGRGTTRCTFRGPGILVVVKVFDPKGDGDYSVKFYNKPERYEHIKSYWTTIEKVTDQEEVKCRLLAYLHLTNTLELAKSIKEVKP